MSAPIPQEALDAAAAKLAELLHQSAADPEDIRWASLILLDALPHLPAAGFYLRGVKAERERVAQLAGEHGATYQDCPCDPARGIGDPAHKPSQFADLIREPS